MTKNISDENIRVAAYYIWEKKGCPSGADYECWIEACEQVLAPKKSCSKKNTATEGCGTKTATKKASVSKKKETKKEAPVPFYGAKKKTK